MATKFKVPPLKWRWLSVGRYDIVHEHREADGRIYRCHRIQRGNAVHWNAEVMTPLPDQPAGYYASDSLGDFPTDHAAKLACEKDAPC